MENKGKKGKKKKNKEKKERKERNTLWPLLGEEKEPLLLISLAS